MENVWLDPLPIRVSNRLQNAVGGHRLVAATLARRGIRRSEEALAFLIPENYVAAPAEALPNMMLAVTRLEHSIQQGEQICVWGDFDVDGQTSTTLLVEALRVLGADVTYYIPLRETESHGVHIPSLEKRIAEGAKLLLTCDTGVTAHDAVAYARNHGVEMIITDHHDLPADLPDAHAVVNPKMLPTDHPLYGLPGVGVAYKLVEALFERADRLGWVDRLLDLVALGIVADLAELRNDVRFQLQRGLEVLRQTPRLGLKVMMELAQVRAATLTEEGIAFALAPRMNALGRLADANASVEFLTTDDVSRARILANEMEGLNARRKLLSDQVTQAAQELIEAEPSLLDQPALVVARPGWPVGVVGIVASRLAEKYRRPTVVLSISESGLARGSARSIEGVDISTAIAEQSEMLTGFGGHPMAAGLRIEADRVPEFQRALSAAVSAMLDKVDARPRVQIDGYVQFSDLSMEFVADLNRLAPFGPGNPRLTLATRDVAVKSVRELGREGDHLLLVAEDMGGATQKVVWWRGAERSIPEGRFDLAFHVDISDYEGLHELRLTWVDSRTHALDTLPPAMKRQSLRIIDWRGEGNVPDRISQLMQESIQVWVEGERGSSFEGRDRYQLEPSKTLAILTAPPGPEELRMVLQRVSPQVVYLFAEDPGFTEPQSFLKQLTGMIKYALRVEGGRVRISTLAAATAHREITVRMGIMLLTARGDVEIAHEENDEMVLSRGSGERGEESEAARKLEGVLEETGSYRAFFRQAKAETLLAY
ncbi:MAG: single-stranded-DNA-specific exonuclease RecJ [Anaerolineales bacterium]|nr:single-stranded-DNA-specific exonuclease RecJ [Anaerolineales bacterium]